MTKFSPKQSIRRQNPPPGIAQHVAFGQHARPWNRCQHTALRLSIAALELPLHMRYGSVSADRREAPPTAPGGGSPSEAGVIVNADDYGYFRCVSRGILAAAQDGVVTATGIMANGPAFHDFLPPLKELESLDCGVHLNLSYGEPLTEGMRRSLSRWGGRFPHKTQIALAVLSRQISLAQVAEEWRRQISRCTEHGVSVQFLNSHEHLHMLPALFRLATTLATEFGIPHVRYATPEWRMARGPSDWARNAALGGLGALASAMRRRSSSSVPFLGAGASGKLSLDYFRVTLPRLRQRRVYELMCHPGLFDPKEITDPALLSYHDWEQEVSVLRSSTFANLCRIHNIRPIGYRHIASP